MKFYKLLNNKDFIGVASSANFYEFNPRNHTFLLANEKEGQFIDIRGKLYRDYWMPEVPDYSISYETVNITEIEEEEYNTIIEALRDPEVSQEIFIQPEIEEEEIFEVEVTEDLDYLKRIQITKFSKECNKIIENGFNLTLDNEEMHFSLTTQDQLNLLYAAEAIRNGEENIPYHADSQPYKIFTKKSMSQIIDAANAFKTYHTSYYNALKFYINSLTTVDEIISIKYGDDIPEEYKNEVLKEVEQGESDRGSRK